MTRWRWLALVALLLVACAAVGWRLFSDRVNERLRVLLEEQLSNALATGAEVEGLSVTLAPPQMRARSVAVGPDGAWLRAERLAVRILPYASLRQMRPVLEVEGDGVWIDVTRLAGGGPSPGEAPGESVLPFRIRRLRLGNARARIPVEEHPLDLSVDGLRGHVEAGQAGRITLALAADGIVLERRDGRVALDRVRLEGGQTAQGLVVRKLEARGEDIEIGAALEEREPLRHRLHGEVDLARFAGLDERLDGLGGRLRLVAVLTGALEDPAVEGSLSGERLRARGEEIDALRARVVRRGDRVTVEHATLKGFGGEARVAGSLATSGEQEFALRVGARDLDLAAIAARAGVANAPALRAVGLVELSGKLKPFSVAANGKGRLRGDEKAALLAWEIETQTEGAVSRIRLVATQQKGNRAEANVTLGPDAALGGTVEAAIEDTGAVWALVGIEDPTQATGTFSLSADLSGTTDDPRFEGRIGGRAVKVRGGAVERVEGAFAGDLRQVRADGVRIAFANGTVQITGTFGIDPAVENAWDVRIDKVDPGALAALAGRLSGTSVPVAGGSLSASLSGRGPWRTAVLQGSAQARGFSLAGERVEALDLTVGAHLPSWTMDARLVHREGEILTARGEGEGVGRVAARLESTSWSLAGLTSAAESGLGGTMRIEGSVRGPLNALEGAFDVAGAGWTFDERKLGDVRARVGAVAGAWNADARLLDGALQVSAKLLDRGRFSVDAGWTDAHFGPLLRPDGTLRVDSSGTLRVAGSTAAPLAVDGELVVPVLELARGGYAAAATETVRVRARAGTFAIESLRLAGKNGTLAASGTFTTSGRVDVDVNGDGSLRLLETIGEPVESARGTFALTMSVDRPVDGTPRLDGRLSLSAAALDVGLPFGPTETAAEIRFAGSRAEIERLTGNIGGGTFSVGGAVDLSQGPDVTWQVREMSTGMLPHVEHELSGDGTLRGSWDELTVAGRIEILRALYDRRIEITSFLPSFRRELARAPDTELAEGRTVVRLDLDIVASDELYIDNNFARIEAAANLRVTGDASNPRIGGQVQALNGEVFFREHTFDVTTAVVDFRPELGLVASLNISAETEINTGDGTYTVTLQVSGTTDNPRVIMTADDPSLTQTDVASLIAFGKTVAQLQQEGGGVAVSEVFLLAPGGYPDRVTDKAATLLRLDRVDVEPTFSRTTGEFEPQLILGKNFGENLSTSLVATFGSTASQILRVTYQLTPRFSLLATAEPESQNRGEAFGGGVRYRRTFRDTPGFSLLELGDRGSTQTSPP